MRTIFRTKFGSHLYGTDTPESDLDYKSIHLPDAKDILLQKVKGSVSLVTKRNKQEGERNTPEEVDDESYSLQKYLNLLAEGQTVAIDMLFAPDPQVSSSLWTHICFNRDKLLTKKSASFLGYCRTQANKYGIKGSRVAAAKKARDMFCDLLDTFGSASKVEDHLPLVEMMASCEEHMRMVTKETTVGKFETYFECCNRMVGIRNTVKEAQHIFSRIYEEYGARARMAESNEGIDWKALSHAVRVGHEAKELLLTGYITFPLPNAFHILEIKQGKLPYAEVAEEIENLLVEVESASEKSNLRDEADWDFINELVADQYAIIVSVDNFFL